MTPQDCIRILQGVLRLHITIKGEIEHRKKKKVLLAVGKADLAHAIEVNGRQVNKADIEKALRYYITQGKDEIAAHHSFANAIRRGEVYSADAHRQSSRGIGLRAQLGMLSTTDHAVIRRRKKVEVVTKSLPFGCLSIVSVYYAAQNIKNGELGTILLLVTISAVLIGVTLHYFLQITSRTIESSLPTFGFMVGTLIRRSQIRKRP